MTMTEFGGQVRVERKRRGWNQTKLAFRARMHPSCVSLIENGRLAPTTNQLQRLSRVLGLEVSNGRTTA